MRAVRLLLALSAALLLVGLAGRTAWIDDLKLRLEPLTRYFHDRGKDLRDVAKAGGDPASHARIDLRELLDGGPPKDGIPSIDRPQFEDARATPYRPDDAVLGVTLNGEAKAYPLLILDWHEIVNDVIGGVPVTVTYCPLCDTGIVFERGRTTFGVSGKLFQSCLVMYDRADDSLYAQPWGIGVVGGGVNRVLPRVAAVRTTLGAWLALHPESKVLSRRTGFHRDYLRYPYGSYATNRTLLFPVRGQEGVADPKAPITYVWRPDGGTPFDRFSGASRAFSDREVKERGSVSAELGGRRITARWDPALAAVVVTDEAGKVLPASPAFAFVYPAFFGGQKAPGPS
jgi:hypothetical protein